jgi:predicted nuclease of predicted toxin-antitoxin system
MRLLLDESVPAKLRRALAGHGVRTAVEMEWSGVKNGEMLALAAADFDAFVTVDKNLPYQQNIKGLPIAVVVLDAASNDLHILLPLIPELERRLAMLVPRACLRIRHWGLTRARPIHSTTFTRRTA